jgi:gliding motility-associated-like protein
MIKFRIILLVSFLFCFGLLYSQKQNNQWRFGFGGALDFNTLPPSFVNGCVIAATEGSASVADRITGALLFYTDGVTVWNANNQIMPNGTGLLGGVTLSSTTAAVIVPKPGSSNLYYIITVDEFTSNNGVRYSVVDMTLNGGLGDIVAGQKNIFLFQTNEERLEVVPASDGQSYWLLTHNNSNSSFYSFRINNTGIQNTPVVSTVGSAFQINQGHIKINKQFNKVAMGIGDDSDIELFDFDNATGVLSNPITLNFNLLSIAYGIEFSPDGKLLYFSDGYSILQLDLTQTTALAIQNSAYQVATSQGGVLQLGIDEKIYVASKFTIDAINCPNKLGAACGYQTNVIATGPTWGGSTALPKWVYYADDPPLPTSNSIVKNGNCQGLPISFSLQNTSNIVSVSWNFGDPASGTINNTSSSLTPQHTYNTAGSYTVNVVINYTCSTETIPLTFTINSAVVPTFNTIPDLCVGDTAPVLPTTSLNGIIGIWSPTTISTSSSGASTYTFTPNTGQCASVIPITITVNPLVTPTFNTIAALCVGDTAPILPITSLNGIIGIWSPTTVSTSSSGTSTYTFTPNTGQCASVIPITITVNPLVTPTFNPIPDLCVGDTAPVLPTTSLNGIVGTWNLPTISTSSSGSSTYTFTPNAGQCANPFDLLVSVQNVIDFEITGSCVSNNFVLEVTPVNNTFNINTASFNWLTSNQQSVGSNSNTFNVTQYLNSTTIVEELPITFSVTVTPANGCPRNEPYEIQKIVCTIQKGISVNNDGANEFLDLQLLDVSNLNIYSRYGVIVYSKRQYKNEWMGQSNNGDNLPDGTYFYEIEFNNGDAAKTGWIYKISNN